MTSHTPAPWRVGDAGQTIFGPKTNRPSPKIIATIHGQEDKALIVAAPELLQALRDIANLNEPDLAKYCAKVDDIACATLARLGFTL